MVGGREERAGLPKERGKAGECRDSIQPPSFSGVCAAGEAFWFTRAPLFILVCMPCLCSMICVSCVGRGNENCRLQLFLFLFVTHLRPMDLNVLSYNRLPLLPPNNIYVYICIYIYNKININIILQRCHHTNINMNTIIIARGRELFLNIFPSLPGSRLRIFIAVQVQHSFVNRWYRTVM